MKIYNFGNNRIGDKVASCYQLSYCAKQGEKIVLIDPTYTDRNSFCVQKFFWEITPFFINCETKEQGEAIYDEMVLKGFETFDFHNLWISSPSLKETTNHKLEMQIPNDLIVRANNVSEETGKLIKDYECVVVHHPLIDAGYNQARNVDIHQWRSLINRLKYEYPNVFFLEVPIDYKLTVEEIMALLYLGNIYIGGDTGFSHLYSAIHPDRPIVSIYPDEKPDRDAFEWEREKFGYSHSWCSDPINSFNNTKFILTNNQFDDEQVFNTVSEKIKEKIK